ncbi:ABC-three component system middle component 6 [Mycoplasma feriruminatoris]|uniref:ABC-three component system middle component 6 n=1 Tax=Mycoplasma feriruminatoris TaxID=1179777 RepID=UPI0002A522D3|nr:ABC-three component system middle component 6 [Mycoplasma feriruminatoris]UKS53964.1 hypothetical protein D500_00308 [Mycoplasma feriruminatoris]UKS53985.1 hypothetical protein D500_00329 [Mycoplasma feriruminatoris]WFQ90048.1 hypothetical protein MFERI11561_00290 [Mycoplasma feriruminatoris]WFQ94224.1 hypothetical protein MFERI15220_00292 [Mycoplasma feriruminatoris]WFQ95870.1 hypothetical protein MFERI15568_00294 [Mycoplasma feriruminatoris]
MLIPDNVQPKLTVYYNASLVLKVLYEQNNLDMVDLYANIKKIDNIPFNLFLLSLDWLYLTDKIDINDQGVVHLCL